VFDIKSYRLIPLAIGLFLFLPQIASSEVQPTQGQSLGETSANLGGVKPFIVGTPLEIFRKKFPKAECFSSKAIIQCRFAQLPPQLCPFLRCYRGGIFFERAEISGFAISPEPIEWAHLVGEFQDTLGKAHESTTRDNGETTYMYVWTIKDGELLFKQSWPKSGTAAPNYMIFFKSRRYFKGQPPITRNRDQRKQ
jgi:hypothetical protein